MSNIVIRQVDDWIAVYKDGEMVYQNHSCPLTEGLLALGIEFKHDYRDYYNPFESVGEFFPERIDA